MDRLADLAKVLRSKNSGPFELTLDVLFADAAAYERVKRSGAITREAVARLYRLDPAEITQLVFFDSALGVKITFNRRVSSGTAGDRDVYGAQQHAPLMRLQIP
ncbi:MAG: DUF4387 domain-containing protein [Christensenellaceae bacterium]|nr:DUF4387 domain-containing protein [Christensenellaceae bacterium]MEA5068513.1 DUF4387 domain-containing protein [Christensenellaceae bacterium]